MNAPYYTIDITNSSQIATITEIVYAKNDGNDGTDGTIEYPVGNQLFYVSEIPNVVRAVVESAIGNDVKDYIIKTVSIKLHKLKFTSNDNDNENCGFVFGQVYNGDMNNIDKINFSTLCESDIFKKADLPIEFVKTFKGNDTDFKYDKVIAQSCNTTNDEPNALSFKRLDSSLLDKSVLPNLFEGYSNIDNLRNDIENIKEDRNNNKSLWFIYNLLRGYFNISIYEEHEKMLSHYVQTITECNENFKDAENPPEIFSTALSTYLLIVNYNYENKSQFITSAKKELSSIYNQVKEVLSQISKEAELLNQNVSSGNVETFMSDYESLNNVYETYNEVCKTYQNSADDFNFDDINIIDDMSSLLSEIRTKLDTAYTEYNKLITPHPSEEPSEGPSGDTSEEPS